MDGLQVSAKISKLSNEIGALERVLMRIEGDRDFNYEYRVLKTIKEEMRQQKSNLEDKLRSVKF